MKEHLVPRERIALVTGASRGIGREIAVALAKSGMQAVGVHYAVRKQDAAATAELVTQAGAVPFILQQEFTKDPVESASRLATAFLDQVEQLTHNRMFDVLVNNAGIAIPERLGSISKQAVQQTLNANLVVPLFLIQALVSCIRNSFLVL